MKKILIGVSAVLMTTTSVFAADTYQPEPLPIIDAPEIVVQEASGWYLRGDMGYSFNKIRGVKYYQDDSLVDFTRASLKDSFLLGAGVGYQINNYLRTDLTFDYMFKSDFKGATSGWCGGVACTSTDVASLTAYTLMANAYVDIGTYGYVTPYVGAGVGGAYVKWNKLKNTICDNPNPPGPGCYTTEHDGKGSWRFAYALMAGATIDITCDLKADVGYRFRHITSGDMFGRVDNGGPGRDKGIYSHEARVGARYIFNGCATPSYEPPAPLPIVYK